MRVEKEHIFCGQMITVQNAASLTTSKDPIGLSSPRQIEHAQARDYLALGAFWWTAKRMGP